MTTRVLVINDGNGLVRIKQVDPMTGDSRGPTILRPGELFTGTVYTTSALAVEEFDAGHTDNPRT